MTITDTGPAPAPAATDKTLPDTVASVPPAMTVNTVRVSVPMGFTTLLANVIEAESVQVVAMPTPGAAAAEAGAARRLAEHAMVVDTGGGSATVTVPPPGVAAMVHHAGEDGLMLATSAEDDERLLAPTGTARL